MIFETIFDHVKTNLGGREGKDAFIKELINNAYLDLVTSAKFPDLGRMAPIPCPELDKRVTFVTVDGTPDYAYSLIAPSCIFPVALRDITNNYPLVPKEIRWYNRYRSIVDGKPRYYVPWAKLLYLDPTPDDAYTIEMRYRQSVALPALVQTQDVPVLGEEWHEAIELAATVRGARSFGDPRLMVWEAALKQFVVGHSEQYTQEEEDVDTGFRVVL